MFILQRICVRRLYTILTRMKLLSLWSQPYARPFRTTQWISWTVFPDHTAKTAKARAAFNDVRRQLRDIEGARYGLLYPARLRITYNGVEKEFVSAEEASSYVKTLANG
ncbi:hypothetical protein SRHO_G00080700 [Serrasalmus rhombeus]